MNSKSSFTLSTKFKVFLLFFPLLIINPIYAEPFDIEVNWIIEGQLDEQTITSSESQEIISNYEEIIINEENKSEDTVYHEFITDNQYSIGDNEINIYSKEGQALNKILINQEKVNKDNFLHMIKYLDRYSDGYVEIAEALLDPVNEQKYFIKGAAYDHNPNSNLEIFVLERGYTLDNLDAIPNEIFSPGALDSARELITNSKETGKSFDLRELSPNYLIFDESTLQERMLNHLSEQTSQIFNEIITGSKLQPENILADSEILISSQPQRDTNKIFDNFKLEKPQFENTIHVRDAIQNDSIQTMQTPESLEDLTILMIIPVFVGLAIFGYVMSRKLLNKNQEEPLLQLIKPQINFRQQTQVLLDDSMNLFNNNQRKEAHERLGQAIRYYYSSKLGLNKELTTFEILLQIKKYNLSEYDQVKTWLILCGSVEFAKQKSLERDFKDALLMFSRLIS